MKPSVFGAACAILLMLPFAVSAGARAGQPDEPLISSYRDQNRVLLVFAPSEKDVAYQEQMKLWQGEKDGFADRDLVVLPILQEGKSATAEAPATLAKRYDADVKSFKVVLIGKDGHEAYSDGKPVTAEALYRRIDVMPMRREERRQKDARK